MIAAIAMIALSVGAVLEIALGSAIRARSRSARSGGTTAATGTAKGRTDLSAVSRVAKVSGS